MLLQAVTDRYKDHNKWANNMLYDYYTGKWWSQKSPNLVARLVSQETILGKCYNRRKLDELPFQSWQIDKTKYKLSQYLTDLQWMYDKICGSSCFQLLEDIQLSEQCDGKDEPLLKSLKDYLEIYARALNYDGRQFYSHLNRYLEDKLLRDELDSELSKVLELTRNPPVNSLIVINSQDDYDNLNKDNTNDNTSVKNKTFDLVQRLKDTDDYIVSVSTEKEEICVWDIHR